MESELFTNKMDFSRWLSKKLYLASIGFYATIGILMVLSALATKAFGQKTIIASFAIFFIVALLKAAYESLVIYETPIKSLSPKKMMLLSSVTSGIMTIISVAIKPYIGYFSIPVSIIISLLIVKRLKEALWPATAHTGFFAKLPAKLEAVGPGRYIFFGSLVGITYLAYGKLDFNFFYSFAAAFFVSMIFEEFYNLTKLYEQKLDTRTITQMLLWTSCCAAMSSGIVFVMMEKFGYSGQFSTIASVVFLKLIQPIGSHKFVLDL